MGWGSRQARTTLMRVPGPCTSIDSSCGSMYLHRYFVVSSLPSLGRIHNRPCASPLYYLLSGINPLN